MQPNIRHRGTLRLEFDGYSVHGAYAIGTLSRMTQIISPRHSLLVRVTHWLTVFSFLALLVTGVEIIISHPRFYWGETGNVNIRPLFTIPIPSSGISFPPAMATCFLIRMAGAAISISSRHGLLVGTGLLYVAFGFFGGHFRRNLLPARSDLSPKRLGNFHCPAFAFRAAGLRKRPGRITCCSA